MLRTFNTLFAIRISSSANRFIYYARKLPLLGRRIPDSVYSSLEVKQAVTIVALIATVIWGFLSKLAYTGFLLYLPVAAWGKSLPQGSELMLFLHIFLLLSFVAAGVSSATVLEPKREKYVAVKLLRMSPSAYMRTSLGYRYITYFIYYIPALLLFSSLLGASMPEGLLLAAMITLWKIVCEYLHLKLFETKSIVLIKQAGIVWLIILLGYAAAYAPLLLEWAPVIGSVLLSWPAIVIIGLAGAFAAVSLARYPDYLTVVDAASKRDDPLLDIGRMMSDAQKSSVQTKDSDVALSTQPAGNLSNKEGYAYLTALFFARHRSLIDRPVKMKLAAIGIIGIVGAVAVVLGSQSWSDVLIGNMGAVFPFLALAMNFLSVGEAACRALFYNCDLPLLRYSFYRNDAERHFRIRLLRIAGLNLMIAAALGAALTLVALAAGSGITADLLLLWLCVLTLSLFFSLHHLAMYYLLQPYSTELNMKNPFYFLVNMAVSAACGVSIVVKAPAMAFTLTVAVLTAVYATASLVLVRKFGSRTFRVK